jgi:hypothetical protein
MPQGPYHFPTFLLKLGGNMKNIKVCEHHYIPTSNHFSANSRGWEAAGNGTFFMKKISGGDEYKFMSDLLFDFFQAPQGLEIEVS